MFLSGGPRKQAGRRQFIFRAATLAAGLLVGAATLSGCGGGGGSSNPSSSPTPVATTTVTGRVVDNNTSANISGITVKFGSLVATTGTDGTFTFTVPTNTPATSIILVFPTDSSNLPLYYNVAYVAGVQYTISTTGYPVTTAQLTSGVTNVGDIRVFSTSSPPPPPSL